MERKILGLRVRLGLIHKFSGNIYLDYWIGVGAKFYSIEYFPVNSIPIESKIISPEDRLLGNSFKNTGTRVLPDLNFGLKICFKFIKTVYQ